MNFQKRKIFLIFKEKSKNKANKIFLIKDKVKNDVPQNKNVNFIFQKKI